MSSSFVLREEIKMVLDSGWYAAEKEIDPHFEGSIFQFLGLDAELCPTCGAHLHGGICLNTCHLAKASREKFARLIAAGMEEE